MAPGYNERAGKRKGGKTRKGSPRLRAVLVYSLAGKGATGDLAATTISIT